MKAKCLLLLILIATKIIGQTSFTVNNKIFGNTPVKSIIPIAISDLNGDNLDDIIVLDQGKFLKAFIQNHNNESYSVYHYGQVSVNPQNAIAVAKLDDTDYKEIIIGGTYDGMKIYKSYDGISLFLKFRESAKNFFTQNISLVDINADGFLDILVNDDDNVPILFINEEGERFMPTTELIDLSTGVGGNSGNYGSIWTDFDGDGDVDLYISKCRIGVTDPLDLRRINRLYVNDGNWNFTEMAAEFGLAIGEQSWVTEFADLDNDGDKDIIMLNHTNSNFILENVGAGVYEERHVNTDFEENFESFQLIVRDFDNNGFKDILITGLESRMYWNFGDFSFVRDDDIFKNKILTSAAVGDLNDDGFWDIYASYSGSLISANKFFNDEILINQGNNHSYIKVSVYDEQGNSDGIGAEIKLYGQWGVQAYEVRVGESYGITNSDDIIFGLGDYTSIDSMTVRWSSGNKTVYKPQAINTHYMVFNSGFIAEVPTISIEGLTENVLCSGENFSLSLAGDYDDFIWSTGSESSSIILDKGGHYFLSVFKNGHKINVPGVFIQEFNQVNKPIIEDLSHQAGYCFDEMITLTSDYKNNLTWTNGAVSDTIIVTAGVPVSVSVNICDTLVSEPFYAHILEIDTPFLSGDTIQPGQVAFLSATDSVFWYKNIDDIEHFAFDIEVSIENILSDSTFYASKADSFLLLDFCGRKDVSIPFQYGGNHINGGISFSVKNHKSKLHKVTCYTDFPGKRLIQLKDFWGGIINEREVYIDSGKTEVILDFNLIPSVYYYLTTDREFNEAELGTRSPQLHRDPSPNIGLFPIISDSGNIFIETNSDQTPYFYFYDWVLLDVDRVCESERVPVNVVVDIESSTDDIIFDINIYPSPFQKGFNLSLPEDGMSFRIFTQNGVEVMRKDRLTRNEFIEMNDFPSGIYVIRIINKKYAHIERIIKF